MQNKPQRGCSMATITAYLIHTPVEVDFTTYGAEPGVGLDAGFDVDGIYSVDAERGMRDGIEHLLSEKALEEIWQQVYKHIEALKGEV